MLMTKTDGISGRKVVQYPGIVKGDALVGATLFRDLYVRFCDIVGVVDLDYEPVGVSMLIVSANGIAVRLD